MLPLSLIIAIITASLIITFLMFWLGIKGKTLDDHPVCKKCKYDLSGFNHPLPSPSLKCPECGHPLTSQSNIQVGNKHKNKPLIISSIIILIAIIALPVWASFNYDWTAQKPIWLLRFEAKHPDQFKTSRKSLLQLIGYISIDQTSHAQTLAAFDDAIEMIRNDDVLYDNLWSDVIAHVFEKNLASTEEAEQYAQAFLDSLIVKCRKTVLQDHVIAISIRSNKDRGHIESAAIYLPIEVTAAAGNNKPHNFGEIAGVEHVGFYMNLHLSDQWLGKLPLGEHDLKLNLKFSPSLYDGENKPFAIVHRELNFKVNVISPDQIDTYTSTVKGAEHKAAAENAAKRIKITRQASDDEEENPEYVSLVTTINFNELPAGLAHDVYLSNGEQEKRIGAYTVSKKGKAGHMYHEEVPASFVGEREKLDIILRPHVKIIFESTDQNDFLDETLILKDIKITER
ncbi:hypothetical protein JD969_05875 [Planctomycetota bacterium]|nr:hypothetical protein JD969_05875 [Planctomycetota bacterium]